MQHYDGENPNEPLGKDHFTKEQQQDAENLGDGSPGIDPRRDAEQAKKEASRDAASKPDSPR